MQSRENTKVRGEDFRLKIINNAKPKDNAKAYERTVPISIRGKTRPIEKKKKRDTDRRDTEIMNRSNWEKGGGRNPLAKDAGGRGNTGRWSQGVGGGGKNDIPEATREGKGLGGRCRNKSISRTSNSGG